MDSKRDYLLAAQAHAECAEAWRALIAVAETPYRRYAFREHMREQQDKAAEYARMAQQASAEVS